MDRMGFWLRCHIFHMCIKIYIYIYVSFPFSSTFRATRDQDFFLARAKNKMFGQIEKSVFETSCSEHVKGLVLV